MIAPRQATAWILLIVIGGLFAIPLVAMLEFSLRAGLDGGYDLHHWAALVDPENERKYRTLVEGLVNSAILCVATVGIVLLLLLPTMVFVRLRLPRWQRVLEVVCTIPITIPAIVLVVGLALVYSVVSRIFGSSPWTLAFAYGITCLPYAYRALDASMRAVDLVTVMEAARSLGSNAVAAFFRVVLPVLRRGVLAASFITLAVVLGEFTIASILNRTNLQTSLVNISRSDAQAAVIVSLLSLVFVFVILFVLGRVEAARTRRSA